MKKPDEEIELRIRPRESTAVPLSMPKDVIASVERVAARRDMSVEALLKLYIGQGLRQDLSQLYAERVIQTAAHVLGRHLESQEEVSAILQEIRAEASG